MATSEHCDEQVAIDLHMADFQHFIEQRKGKERLGDVSDHDLTLLLWEQELETTQQSWNDRRLAMTISNAIATDQHLISEIQREDLLCNQDRAIALNLAEDEEVLPPITPILFGHRSGDVEAESVCEVIGSLAQMSMSDDSSTATSRDALPNTRASGQHCVSCLETMQNGPLFLPACGHMYCNGCVHQMFLAATKDEELYPPRCCRNVFPPGIALRLLNYQELTAFGSKGVEFSCSDRTYCGDPKCSVFIPPWEICEGRAHCPKCKLTTHTSCKALWSRDHECSMDEALQHVLSLGEVENWRRCPHCKTLVELRQGCNHITCRCGKEFCYVCGADWRTCRCPLWAEARLYDVANRIVDDQVPANEGEVVRAQVFAEALEQLRNHEAVGCEHGRRSQWRYLAKPFHQCEVCYHTLPEYIFECKSCRILACNRCIRNRMR